MDAFTGEVRVFGFPFAPRNWALCAGQLMSISQNTALFSLLGTYYGGDGRSTFALPNLQGNVPVHVNGTQGQGPGLQTWQLGEQQGTTSVTLQLNQVPTHTHSLMAVSSPATGLDPSNASLAEGVLSGGRTPVPYYQSAAPNAQMNPIGVGQIGGSQPHNNMMPFLALNYCICLYGIYPARP